MTRCPEAGCRFYTFAAPARALAAHRRLAHQGSRPARGSLPPIVLDRRTHAERLASGDLWPNPH